MTFQAQGLCLVVGCWIGEGKESPLSFRLENYVSMNTKHIPEYPELAFRSSSPSAGWTRGFEDTKQPAIRVSPGSEWGSRVASSLSQRAVRGLKALSGGVD